MNNILSLISKIKSPSEVALDVAQRVRAQRLELNLTQKGLASKAGLKLPTYRRFERSGEVSLRNLLQIAMALDVMPEFDALFATKKYETLDDVLQEKTIHRKRGQRNS